MPTSKTLQSHIYLSHLSFSVHTTPTECHLYSKVPSFYTPGAKCIKFCELSWVSLCTLKDNNGHVQASARFKKLRMHFISLCKSQSPCDSTDARAWLLLPWIDVNTPLQSFVYIKTLFAPQLNRCDNETQQRRSTILQCFPKWAYFNIMKLITFVGVTPYIWVSVVSFPSKNTDKKRVFGSLFGAVSVMRWEMRCIQNLKKKCSSFSRSPILKAEVHSVTARQWVRSVQPEDFTNHPINCAVGSFY